VACTAISRLPEFSDAFDRGKTVTELRAGNRAAEQIVALLEDLEKFSRRIGAGAGVPKLNGAAREALQRPRNRIARPGLGGSRGSHAHGGKPNPFDNPRATGRPAGRTGARL